MSDEKRLRYDTAGMVLGSAQWNAATCANMIYRHPEETKIALYTYELRKTSILTHSGVCKDDITAGDSIVGEAIAYSNRRIKDLVETVDLMYEH